MKTLLQATQVFTISRHMSSYIMLENINGHSTVCIYKNEYTLIIKISLVQTTHV